MANLLYGWDYKVYLAILTFGVPVALVIVMFSSCDVRRRGDKRACRDGSAERCIAVGKFYESRSDGMIGYLMSNTKTAKEYYQRGCKLGNVTSCARFGHMKIAGGENQARDDRSTNADGIAALTTACNGGIIDSCRELVAAGDASQAAPALDKLCKGGDTPSCAKLVSAVAATDPKAAIDLEVKQCEAGNDEQCVDVANTLLHGSGDDPARGIALLAKACDGGSWTRCSQLGHAYLDGPLTDDGAHGIELVGKACEHGDNDGCFWLGKAQLATDPAKAVATFTAECKNDPRGCDALGDIYRVGVEGIPKNLHRAHKLYDDVCLTGSVYACEQDQCMRGDSDACAMAHKAEENEVVFRLGGKFDIP